MKNIKDFGAVGDGTTDDTNIILKAIRSVYCKFCRGEGELDCLICDGDNNCHACDNTSFVPCPKCK